MKLSSLKIDSKVVENGAWVDDIPDLPGLRLCVRGSRNADARRLRVKLVEAIPRAERLNGIPPRTADEIDNRVMAETMLIGWEGLTEDDGTTPLAFSPERALEILQDPDLVRFRDGVAWAIAKVEAGAAEDLKADLGN